MKITGPENTVHELVKNIEPFGKLEREHINDALSWIESGVNIYRVEKPDKPPKHLVSYFVLIDPEHASLLLVDHIKAQLWLPSGGHVELREDPKDTVIRESREELNQEAIFLDNNTKPFFVTVGETVGLTAGHTDVSLWYLLQGDRSKPVTFDRGEFNSVRWFTFDKILMSDPASFDPHLQRFTKKLTNYLATNH